MDINIPQDQIWMVVVGFIIAFILAFGIGANDVANSFGTSVGSRVLTLRQAIILASIFETLGAVLLGAKVSDTIRKGVISVDLYKNDTMLLMTGSVAALSGSCVWLLAATLLRLPVSATHSIVGATVGFALVNHGTQGIQWKKLGFIVGSWFISPVMAGLVSTGIFYVCKFFILSKKDALEPGLRFLPIFYAVTIVVNLFSVFYDGPQMLYFDRIPLWGTFIISFGSGIICAIIVRLVVVPWQRRRIRDSVYSTSSERLTGECAPELFGRGVRSESSSQRDSIAEEKERLTKASNIIMPPGSYEDKEIGDKTVKVVLDKSDDVALLGTDYKADGDLTKNSLTPTELTKTKGLLVPDTGFTPQTSPAGSDDRLFNEKDADAERAENDESSRSLIKDRPETAHLFSFLQILTAVFGAFAHGGNDVSNSIGPVVTLWLIATSGVVTHKQLTPIWILIYGGVGISLGLWALGRRVIKTMGEDLTKVTPSSGFCIEIGSALTVLIASNIGIPISTTHCKVGSVVFVGRFRSRENVDWHIFRNIVLAWMVTLPVAGGVSAAIMAGLKLII